MDNYSSDIKLSFIIPTLNEEKHIGQSIDSIKSCVNDKYKYQIIVSDNGSIDKTRVIAEEKGAKVIHLPRVKISTLRNEGVRVSQGEILVFIDADVWLHVSWGEHIEQIIESLVRDPNMVTGSISDIPENGSWIEKYWFSPAVTKQNGNYVNGGHIIVTRKTFDEIGGFNEDLETGEDYEFCQRAKSKGITIINNPMLKVIHEGYPKDIKNFYRRERWHAKGDYVSIKALFRSKPAILSLGNIVIFCMSIISALCLKSSLILLYVIYIIGISSLSSLRRTKKMDGVFFLNTFLYVIYFGARSMALIDVTIASISRKHSRLKS